MAGLFAPSPRAEELKERLLRYMDEHIYPNETALFTLAEDRADVWQPLPLIEELKAKAKAKGLWNLFLPDSEHGAGLSNLDYAGLCEVMGRSHWAPEVFNCNAPDTGNMELLARFGTAEQRERWLKPLLAGEIRSGFAMTEPDVASSDATNIAISIRRDGGDYVIDGRKWWTTGVGDPRCKVLILMGKTSPDHPDPYRQQSMLLVPMETPGVEKVRMLTAFGYSEAPHGHAELRFEGVRVPAENLLLGEGRGFEIAQARLGPGRIHHCMRLIGRSERAIEKMCRRLSGRVAFGRPVAEQSVWLERIAESRILIDQARLLTLEAACKMDGAGSKAARAEIAMIKVAAPAMAQKVIDWAIQAHGGAGICDDFSLPFDFVYARTMRIADGPDEVHRNQIARLELRKYPETGTGSGAAARKAAE
jgi:acyl-CoA dehydrogenase